MYTHNKTYITAGIDAQNAKGALVMLHGRGGSAEDILGLSDSLNVKDMAVYAPTATNNSWYPYSFMAPEQNNQPALGSALEVLGLLVERILADGIAKDHIYFTGFSQGACLMLEFLARNANKYGGAAAFTGGLIGDHLNEDNYSGNFQLTPILITTGDPDPHVPLARVEDSYSVLKRLNANAMLKVFPGRPHTISRPEIVLANQLIFTD